MNRRRVAVIAAFFSLQLLVALLSTRGPFSDEGTYVLAGLSQLLHQNHFVGYKLWLAGTPYIFPRLAAAGYRVAGLAGSRCVAVALYSLGLLFFGHFVIRLLGRAASFWATLLFCIDGTFFSFAHLAVYDAAAFAAVCGCAWSVVELGRTGRSRWAVLAAALGALAAVSKYSVVIALLSCLGLPLASYRRCRWSQIVGMVIGTVVLSAAYMITVHGELIPPSTLQILQNHQRGLDRWHLAFSIAFVLLVPLLIGVPGAIRIGRRRRRLAALLMIGSISWPVLHVITTQQVSLHKDALFGLIFLLPAAGVALSRLWTARPAVTSALVAGLLFLGTYQWYVEDHSWSDVRPVADFLVPKLAPYDTVAIATGWDFAMYAVASGALPNPRSVLDGWRVDHGADICTARWIVGIRPDHRLEDGVDRRYLMNAFARDAEQCGFTPVATFPADYYYVWPPLVGHAPVELVIYRQGAVPGGPRMNPRSSRL